MISDRLPVAIAIAWLVALAPLASAMAQKPAAPKEPAVTSPDRLIHRVHHTMGTLVTIMAWTDDDETAVTAMAAAFAEYDRIDKLMTTWLPDSEVSRINSRAGTSRAVVVSRETLSIIKKARWGAQVTQGSFDITVGAFKGAWKFGQNKNGTIPSSTVIAQRRRLVNWRDVLINPKASTVRLRKKGQRITLGGIAKGHATDRAVAILTKAGLVNFIVQAGGDMYVAGTRGNRKWKVGIRDPRSKQRSDFFAYAEVKNQTFSTSGDYERFVILNGKRYHHLLDPKTGRPATRSRSVTVMAKDALTADVLSTGLFVLGHVRGMRVVERMKGVEAVFVDANNKVHVSSGLTGVINQVKPPSDGI